MKGCGHCIIPRLSPHLRPGQPWDPTAHWQGHPRRGSQGGSQQGFHRSQHVLPVFCESLLQATGMQSRSTPTPPPTQVCLLDSGQTFSEFSKNPKENTFKSTVISETNKRCKVTLCLTSARARKSSQTLPEHPTIHITEITAIRKIKLLCGEGVSLTFAL